MTSLPKAADIPPPLLDHDQWVCWREQTRSEKVTKVPVNPATGRYASTNKPETWTSFDDARSYATDSSVDGIGFVFTEADPFVGVDLDDARDPDSDTATGWAAKIMEQLDSYTEISPSETGYHVLVEGTLPPGRNRRGDVELYEDGRFFTVTGDHVQESPTDIHERTDALTTVYTAHVETDDTSGPDDSTVDEDEPARDEDDRASNTEPAHTETGLTDDEVIEHARAAANSAKFERLWRGDTAGYDSHSEADMALSCLLAFWTGGETSQMDRLFRRSGLHREKWDAVHYGDGRTYGETTIERAVSVTSDVYSPSADDGSMDTETVEKRDSTATATPEPMVTSTNGGVVHAQERERARIETITKLERRLRELEAENERLRDERDTERAKRRTVEGDAKSDSVTGILARLKQVFVRESS
ncbi:phage NrS-1 polymerase family protein [Haladaptatus sp. NG-WS-4]